VRYPNLLMAFTFISHAGVDKPRIRCVCQHLIDRRVRLWIDRPHEMGLGPNHSGIHRIRPGQRWQEEIWDAVAESNCVLLLASKHLLEPTREVWRREVDLAFMLRKLVVVRIDDVELSKVDLPHDLQPFQRLDIRLAADGSALDPVAQEALEMLPDAVRDIYADQARRRFGQFDVATSPPPNEEQLRAFLMMMGRDVQARQFVGCTSGMGLGGGASDQVPRAFSRRLPRVDLPYQAWTGVSDEEVQADAMRARLILGDGVAWHETTLAWPDLSVFDQDQAFENVLQGILTRSAVRVANGPSLEERLRELCERLRQTSTCQLLVTGFVDRPSLRKAHLALLCRLAQVLKSFPSDRFRFYVHVYPNVEPRSFFRAPWDHWLRATGRRATKHPPVELSDIGRLDLAPWCKLMSWLVARSTDAIEQAVDEAYGMPSRPLSFAELERRLGPIVRQWPVKTVAPADPSPSRWTDEA